MKCQTCERNEIVWAWQPFGPDKDMRSGFAFSFPGNHARGFPVIKVCDKCKVSIQNNNDVSFRHKKLHYWTQGKRILNETMSPF